MLAQLMMEIECAGLDYRKSSALQGVMFENIDGDYAGFLHMQQIHPYSQCFYKDDGKSYWVINALNDEAEEKIVNRFLGDDFTGFHIDKGQLDAKILDKKIKRVSERQLLEEFYEERASKTINLSLLTPMAFKQRGNVVPYPDIRLMYQSLMFKYSMASMKMDMIDEDTLEQMSSGTVITKYSIRSKVFPMEGVVVPGGVGNIRLKITGADTMARYARLLFRFAEFSGIGIKTAMGMGAVRIMEGV